MQPHGAFAYSVISNLQESENKIAKSLAKIREL